MFGAQGLDVSPLKGRTMLNLDSEATGVVTVSCAGGARVYLRWTPACEEAACLPVRVTLSGLRGGHSGVEIDKGRGNANLLMGRLLRAIGAQASMRLVALHGGTADNAIPLSCEAEIAVNPEDAEAVYAAVDAVCGALRAELALTDPGVRVGVAPGQPGVRSVLSEADTARILDALTLAPNGVQQMSYALPGLPETSLNLGVLTLDEQSAVMTFSVRSSVESRKKDLIGKLRCLARLTGAEVEVSGDYPGWAYRNDSPLRERMIRVYKEMFGAEPEVVAIHAGLECGLFAAKLPGLDCVSVGPQMLDIHTAKERMSVSSMARTWDFVKAVLKASV